MDIFGPISKDYCIYFYFLSVAGFILVVLVGCLLVVDITTKKKFELWDFFKYFILAFTYLMGYLQNRLLYSMCNKTLI